MNPISRCGLLTSMLPCLIWRLLWPGNIQQAATGTQNVSNNIAGVPDAANQSGEAAADVLQSSGGLTAESEALSNEVGRFRARIKAA